MDLHLDGKVAIVTGASKGIGLAVTRSLAAEGVRVVAAALTGSPELDVLADQTTVHPVLVDLTEPEGPRTLVDETVATFGAIDILVNNVGGVRPRLDGFLALTQEDWDWSLGLNLFPAVRTMQAAIPHLKAQPDAAIITISSINAHLPDPTVLDYSAAKGALSNVCKSLSKELGPNVRINTISPGPVQTDLWLGDTGVAETLSKATGLTPDAVAKQAVAATASGRFTYPQEIADLVLLLASNRVGNVTGSDFIIYGGLVQTI